MARPYTYKTSDELEQAILRYFAWADENPIRGARSVRNADGTKAVTDDMLPRPYTIFEMCDHIHICDWSSFKRDNSAREGFADIIYWAENKIKAQQVAGAMVGLYRENLTARLNGIAEQVQDVTPPASTIEIVVEE
jgi:hypothetical protein